jgi:cellulose synthase/poly-beta-1,6-N-acetylglucosamine synthase-like glycosyltransferase
MEVAAAVFLISAAALLYVVAGYPLVLKLNRSFKPVRAIRPRRWPTVSVILPVRNGERWMQCKLESLLELDYPPELLQILVISDNSTDGTEGIVSGFAPRVALYRNPCSGKASAINEGLRQATGEILFFTDVRQPIEPGALKMLVSALQDPQVGVASGELVIRDGDSAEEASVGLYWRYEKWIRKCHSRIDSLLGASGSIYAMRRSLAVPMPPNTLLDDVHLPLAAFFKGYRVVFIPEAHAYDSPTELNTEFGRKVRTLAGVYQVIRAYPALLGPGNRMWFHFVSHKVARLMLPFALAAMFLSSFFLPQPWAAWMVAGQAGFYALAALDCWMPEKSPVKRLTSVTRTFVVLVLAALCAASILFRSSESFWKAPTSAGKHSPEHKPTSTARSS